MAKHALSERLKATARSKQKAGKMQAALDCYAREQEKPEKSRKSLRTISEEYNVPYETFRCATKPGSRNIREFNAKKRKLSYGEERVVVDWICISADRGFPQTYEQVCLSRSIALHELYTIIMVQRSKPLPTVSLRVERGRVMNLLGRHGPAVLFNVTTMR